MTITITESSAEVHLQALLDHTVERILFLQKNVIRSLAQRYLSNMNFICSCDESYGQSEYRQTFIDDSKCECVLHFSCTIQLISIDHESKAQIVWKNPRPSSPRFCRPLQFLHEDRKSRVNEVQYIKEQIKSLVSFETVIDGKEISIVYNMCMTFTMIDGKVCNTLTSTKSVQRCYLCGAKILMKSMLFYKRRSMKPI